MKRLLALPLLLTATLAAGQTLELKREGFPLRGPSRTAEARYHASHAAFVCLVENVKAITPHYGETNELETVALHIGANDCGQQAQTLSFTLVQVSGRYHVLPLTEPSANDLGLGGYLNAQIVLSLIPSLTPPPGSYFSPFYAFRMILDHDYDYDPATYGSSVASYDTVHGWKEVSKELIDSYVVDDPANCDPRFPNASCPYTVATYRETMRNTLTGEEITQEYRTTIR